MLRRFERGFVFALPLIIFAIIAAVAGTTVALKKSGVDIGISQFFASCENPDPLTCEDDNDCDDDEIAGPPFGDDCNDAECSVGGGCGAPSEDNPDNGDEAPNQDNPSNSGQEQPSGSAPAQCGPVDVTDAGCSDGDCDGDGAQNPAVGGNDCNDANSCPDVSNECNSSVPAPTSAPVPILTPIPTTANTPTPMAVGTPVPFVPTPTPAAVVVAPTVSLSADMTNITAGVNQPVTLTWSSTNASYCVGTFGDRAGVWPGTKNSSGSQTVITNETTTYGLSCIGSGGTTQAQGATVTAYTYTPTPTRATPGTGGVAELSVDMTEPFSQHVNNNDTVTISASSTKLRLYYSWQRYNSCHIYNGVYDSRSNAGYVKQISSGGEIFTIDGITTGESVKIINMCQPLGDADKVFFTYTIRRSQ